MMEEEIKNKINLLYNKYLRRDIDENSLNHLFQEVKNNNMTLDGIKENILDSPECDLVNPYARLIKEKEPEENKGFFDQYLEFQDSSKTGSSKNRLNGRYNAIIEYNLKNIENKSILDIASHDGRWSFAAIKSGARYVLGIEGRQYLVDNANKNFQKHNIVKEKYEFICGDIHEEIKKLKPNQFDTIFLLGFFYHTIHHGYLLSEIRRLKPKNLIIDGFISDSDKPVIEIKIDQTTSESDAIGKYPKKIVGYPSIHALDLMLKHYGFKYEIYDWHADVNKNWNDLGDYYKKERITIIAKNVDNL